VLYRNESDRPRHFGTRRTIKVLGGALGGAAFTAATLVGQAALFPTTSGAGMTAVKVPQVSQPIRTPSSSRLGLGSTGSITALHSGCRGPSGFGKEFLGPRWPGGFRAVPVYSNGVSGSFTDCLHSTRTPEGRVVLDGYRWQCVELVDRLYLAKGWIEATWRGNGNQMYFTAPRKFRRQRQGHISYVHPGDVISFNAPGGGYGHAAVIGRVQGNYLTIVNQNTNRASMLSHAYLRGGRIDMVGWAGWQPIGVVHAPVH
jgi:hypothetical protein